MVRNMHRMARIDDGFPSLLDDRAIDCVGPDHGSGRILTDENDRLAGMKVSRPDEYEARHAGLHRRQIVEIAAPTGLDREI
jgi:hypothetical protein